MATTPQAKSKSPTIRRILREAAELSNAPSVDYMAEPLESDLFEWHFTIRGPPNSSYSGGLYHGRILLPPTYPLRPPSFRFTTPNGRFEANREICLSISGHHEETWQPAWGIRTAIVALRSFMETDALGQLGGVETTDSVRRKLAGESGSFRCSTCGKSNAEIIKESEARCAEQGGPSDDATEIPTELKLGYRDEMETKKTEASKHQQPTSTGAALSAVEDADVAELAEGFVQTAPQPSGSIFPTDNLPSSTAAPGQGPPQATAVNQNAAAAGPPRPAHSAIAELRRHSDDGVPLWIDRTIVVLVVLLAALLLKIVFDL
ncbi:hypothetical protein NLU13_1669 [Sarocladium strictum]|uniref:UBC core domain-containing protein n=1 Tax=Sarocladium strictum TaxID=5046 RepID=A0AA39GS85_SARSR|nr:hypothetical protein NLU13_1669 [Sarocladium strictum]